MNLSPSQSSVLPPQEVPNVPQPTIEMQPTPSAQQVSRRRSWLAVMLLSLVVIVGAGAYFLWNFYNPETCCDQAASVLPQPTILPEATPTEVFCTADAMICPDGSAVGRTGPNCEFAPCPTTALTSPKPGYKRLETEYFSLDYPQDLIYDLQNETHIISKRGPSQKDGTELYDGFAISISKMPSQGQSLEAFVDASIQSFSQVEIVRGKKTEKIGPYSGFSFITTGLGTITNYYVQGSDPAYVVLIGVILEDPQNQGYQSQLESILMGLKLP